MKNGSYFKYSWSGHADLKAKVLENAKKFYFDGRVIPTVTKFSIAAAAKRGMTNPDPKYQFWYDICKENNDLIEECCNKIGLIIDFVRLTIDIFINRIDSKIVSDSQVQISKNLVRNFGPKNLDIEQIV